MSKLKHQLVFFHNVFKRLEHHLVEYTGTYPGCSVHGNAKQTKQDYVRTTQNKKQEGHDGPVSLHWLIHEIPSSLALQYLGIGLKDRPLTRTIKGLIVLRVAWSIQG